MAYALVDPRRVHQGCTPPWVQFLHFHVVFWEKFGKKIGWGPNLGVSALYLGNPGSATDMCRCRKGQAQD